MSVPPLSQVMQDLFDTSDDVKEMILLGKLPPDIAEIAAEAMTKGGSGPIPGPSPEPYMVLGSLVQQRFFPDAPPLERGGFMKALSGVGPVPAWMVTMQAAAQIVKVARERGYDIPKTEGEEVVDSIRPENRPES